MKNRWFAVLLALVFLVPSLDALARPRPAHGKSAHAKPAAKAGARKATAGKARGKAVAGKSGRVMRDKRGRIIRRDPPPPMVQGEGAATPVKSDPVVPKNIPTRAYAADGQSFYLNGRKIRIDGLPVVGPEGSELAKQRLQKALDSGPVTIEHKGADAEGVAHGVVRVNGRDLADLLLLDEIRSGNLP